MTDTQKLRDCLRNLVELVEMSDEATTPGTDLYSMVEIARRVLRETQPAPKEDVFKIQFPSDFWMGT